MKYPTDIVTQDGDWGRIHRGHELDREALRWDLFESNVATPPHDDSDIVVEQVYFRYVPRMKWCADFGGCDLEGDWHPHWYSVQPNDRSAFTVVHWAAAVSQADPCAPQCVQAPLGVVGSADSPTESGEWL